MQDRTKRWFAIAAPITVLGVVALVHKLSTVHAADGGRGRWYDEYRDRPSVTVTGTLWDFYKKNRREMDPDFDLHGPKGLKGEYCDILRPRLDKDGKPVFSGGGDLVDAPWENIGNQPIIWPKGYIDLWPGDHAGKSVHKEKHEHGDAVTPEEDVEHWWRDDPPTNETWNCPITFTRMFGAIGPNAIPAKGDQKTKPQQLIAATSGAPPAGMETVYVFDSLIPKTKKKKGDPKPPKPPESKKGVDDILALITAGKYKKKRYSFEAETTFVYEKGAPVQATVPEPPPPEKPKHEHDADKKEPEKPKKPKPTPPPVVRCNGQWLSIESQDDVWVYIDGRLVVDIGGAYKGKEKRPFGTQMIELDRLGWLQDGGTYTLKVFMVDRDKGSEKSHLKVLTNIQTLNLVGPLVRKPEYD